MRTTSTTSRSTRNKEKWNYNAVVKWPMLARSLILNGSSNQPTSSRSISRLYYYFALHRRILSAKIQNDFRNLLLLLLLFCSLSFPFFLASNIWRMEHNVAEQPRHTKAFKETDYNDYIKYITTDLMTTYLQTYYTFTAHVTMGNGQCIFDAVKVRILFNLNLPRKWWRMNRNDWKRKNCCDF